MNIVLEGPDGSGKSVLAQYLGSRLKRPVVASVGPPKSQEDIQQRCREALNKDGVVFDRHPVISEAIYGKHRHTRWLTDELITQFVNQRNFIIICVPSQGGLDYHRTKPHDSDQHLQMLVDHYDQISESYSRLPRNLTYSWWRTTPKSFSSKVAWHVTRHK